MAEIIKHIGEVTSSALGLSRIPIAHRMVREADLTNNSARQIEARSNLVEAYVNVAIRIPIHALLFVILGSEVVRCTR